LASFLVKYALSDVSKGRKKLNHWHFNITMQQYWHASLWILAAWVMIVIKLDVALILVQWQHQQHLSPHPWLWVLLKMQE